MYISMTEVTKEDYEKFLKAKGEVIFQDRIGNRKVVIKLHGRQRISERKLQPRNFELEGTNIWSYPHRGNWATHKGNFRGNWAPQVARNIILRYSRIGETVLDQMAGSGTTLVECKLLGRNAIGVDINPSCVMLMKDRLNFEYNPVDPLYPKDLQIKTYIGDARNLDKIEDETIDLIATHPPYTNIIPYSKGRVKGDLSNIYCIDEYIKEMKKVAEESYRVLKDGRYCAILIGDTRRAKHHVPIAFRVMQAFLDVGFILKEDVIKHQWRCKAAQFWLKKSIEYNFLLLMYEHLFIFRKPNDDENLLKLRGSIKWWQQLIERGVDAAQGIQQDAT